jgi:hypothetical protein
MSLQYASVIIQYILIVVLVDVLCAEIVSSLLIVSEWFAIQISYQNTSARKLLTTLLAFIQLCGSDT